MSRRMEILERKPSHPKYSTEEKGWEVLYSLYFAQYEVFKP